MLGTGKAFSGYMHLKGTSRYTGNTMIQNVIIARQLTII
jgi:hypothetical protein